LQADVSDIGNPELIDVAQYHACGQVG
jgi:hypothetical protein